MRKIDYLVGGVRISLGEDSTTPGPRTHIIGAVEAMRRRGSLVRLVVASEMPGMARFARLRQTDYRNSGRTKLFLADIFRIVLLVWSGFWTWVNTLQGYRTTEVIYERIAVFQSLTSFHPAKFRALRVVEANGILARESVRDRKGLVLEVIASQIEKHVLRRSDIVVAVSEALANELVSYAHINRGKILVLPNGIDPTVIKRVNNETATLTTLGFAGSIVAWHNLDKILDVIYQVNKKQATLRFEIIGEGPSVQALKAKVAQHQLEDFVQFSGALPHHDTLARMSRWDIGYAGHERSSSAVMYHSPLKLYEYAAFGLAIVCTPSADAVSLANTSSLVYKFDPTDQETLRTALLAAVSAIHSDTSEARQTRISNAIDAHSWDARIATLERSFAEFA